jgi:choloylglycine hydrolase
MSGTLPDGGKGLIYTSRYAIVGANALGLPAILDGLNDQGLSVGLFYFPNYAKYTRDTGERQARHRPAGVRHVGVDVDRVARAMAKARQA